MEHLSDLTPDFCKEINVPEIGLKGFVVIDRKINRLATGGVRMTEVANLAREMTLK